MNKRMMSEGVESRSLLEKSISRSRRLDAQKQLIKRDDDINRRLERLIKRPECREDDLLLSESWCYLCLSFTRRPFISTKRPLNIDWSSWSVVFPRKSLLISRERVYQSCHWTRRRDDCISQETGQRSKRKGGQSCNYCPQAVSYHASKESPLNPFFFILASRPTFDDHQRLKRSLRCTSSILFLAISFLQSIWREHCLQDLSSSKVIFHREFFVLLFFSSACSLRLLFMSLYLSLYFPPKFKPPDLPFSGEYKCLPLRRYVCLEAQQVLLNHQLSMPLKTTTRASSWHPSSLFLFPESLFS